MWTLVTNQGMTDHKQIKQMKTFCTLSNVFWLTGMWKFNHAGGWFVQDNCAWDHPQSAWILKSVCMLGPKSVDRLIQHTWGSACSFWHITVTKVMSFWTELWWEMRQGEHHDTPEKKRFDDMEASWIPCNQKIQDHTVCEEGHGKCLLGLLRHSFDWFHGMWVQNQCWMLLWNNGETEANNPSQMSMWCCCTTMPVLTQLRTHVNGCNTIGGRCWSIHPIAQTRPPPTYICLGP
jgi:hypothetical protein